MSKKEKIDELVEANNGYLFSSEVEKLNVSRAYISKYVKDNKMERVASGIYITEDTWEDELFIIQRKYPSVVYSGETALYLHDLLDREYSAVFVSVPPNFSGTRLRNRGIEIHREKLDTYELGIEEINTNYGNTVRAYDTERCICDLIKNRKDMEIQNFQSAIHSYMNRKDKKLTKLLIYASKLKISDEVMKYIEVLV
ncbi:MAG: type IV toxin-antitoxin system AbiEi family antitoxin domain-containing protein [Butyrivibrio sp.]|nr:type IV toxin-antitoxin system AbiEi family antitoxin domain-containing protein [Butyrivibrio sp.]